MARSIGFSLKPPAAGHEDLAELKRNMAADLNEQFGEFKTVLDDEMAKENASPEERSRGLSRYENWWES